jgi:hypothetical protein
MPGIFGITRLLARFPCVNECIPHRVLRVFAVLQRAERYGIECTAHFPNDHYESFDVAVNSSSMHFIIGRLHWCDQSLDG